MLELTMVTQTLVVVHRLVGVSRMLPMCVPVIQNHNHSTTSQASRASNSNRTHKPTKQNWNPDNHNQNKWKRKQVMHSSNRGSNANDTN